MLVCLGSGQDVRGDCSDFWQWLKYHVLEAPRQVGPLTTRCLHPDKELFLSVFEP
jgi:hypothetical protein